MGKAYRTWIILLYQSTVCNDTVCKHDSHWSVGVIVDLQSLALTSISFNDLPFLYERIGGSLNISLSTGGFFIRCHFAIRIFLRLGTEGRYSVTNGNILFCVFCLFCRGLMFVC